MTIVPEGKEACGTLMLSLPTIQTAPRFFALLALVERAAGREIVVMGTAAEDARKAAQLGIPYSRFARVAEAHSTRAAFARELGPPVIWVDMEFNAWSGPDLSKQEGLVTLDWVKALQTSKPQFAEEV